MKKIPLRTIKEVIPGQPNPTAIVWADVMLAAVRDGGMQGITVEIMRRRIKVLDRIENAVKAGSAEVLLEDENHMELLQCMQARRFRGVFRAVIELEDAIENAPEVEVAEAPAGEEH